jgi:hypothetical protein
VNARNVMRYIMPFKGLEEIMQRMIKKRFLYDLTTDKMPPSGPFRFWIFGKEFIGLRNDQEYDQPLAKI